LIMWSNTCSHEVNQGCHVSEPAQMLLSLTAVYNAPIARNLAIHWFCESLDRHCLLACCLLSQAPAAVSVAGIPAPTVPLPAGRALTKAFKRRRDRAHTRECSWLCEPRKCTCRSCFRGDAIVRRHVSAPSSHVRKHPTTQRCCNSRSTA
jgi:hypothetical protein